MFVGSVTIRPGVCKTFLSDVVTHFLSGFVTLTFDLLTSRVFRWAPITCDMSIIVGFRELFADGLRVSSGRGTDRRTERTGMAHYIMRP